LQLMEALQGDRVTHVSGRLQQLVTN